MKIRPEDIICHPEDDRVEALVGKEVYAFDAIGLVCCYFTRLVRLGDFEKTNYPFITDKGVHRYIAEYKEPEKKYRPFTLDEFLEHKDRWLTGKKGTANNDIYFKPFVVSVHGINTGMHNLALSFDLALENLEFVDGSPCGVRI